MSSRRRRRRPFGRWLLLLVAVVAAAWWWTSDDRDATAPRVSEVDPQTVVTPEIVLSPEPNGGSARSEPTPPSRPANVSTGPATSSTATTAAPPQTTPPTSAAARLARPPVSATALEALQESARLLATDPLQSRSLLTRAWLAGLDGGPRATATSQSRRLAELTLLDCPAPGESPYLRARRIAPNEPLSLIRQREGLRYGTTFIATLNGLADANRIRAGQDLFIPVGGFDGVVDLSSRDLAIFQDTGDRRELLLVVPIEIGRVDDTPTGMFRIGTDAMSRRHHRIGLEPRPGDARDPDGLEGLELVSTTGAGTGNGRSIRLQPDDAALLYELLGAVENATVEIRD